MTISIEQLNPTLTGLVNSFKAQPVFNRQLAAFIEKNGAPVWDKTIYTLGGDANSGSVSVKTNGIGSFSTTGEVTDNSKGLFLIPLKSTKTGDVQSYITAYKQSDSNYTYRLYNKDSLDRVRPIKDTAKSLLTATEAVFAIFEKSINNKDSINISGTTIRNASLKFGKSQASTNKKLNSNNVKTNTTCVTTITITIYYEQVMFSYMYGPPVYRVSSIEASISMSCFGPDDVQEMQPDLGGGGGNWWEYGTGWPWNNAFGDTQQAPWAFWWTGYSLPYDPYSPENLDSYANSLGRYWENPAYENVPFPAYDPSVDGPYNSDGYRKNGGVYQYSGGTVQNYTNDNGGKYAIFTSTSGVETKFPGATITDFGVMAGAGVTTPNGGIRITSGYGLSGLQHEYGHYLQAQQLGTLYYFNYIVPASLYSAAFGSNHKYFWTEIDANRRATAFFGPSSAIALDDNFPK